MAATEEEAVAALEKYTEAMQTIHAASWPTIKAALLEFYRRYRGQPDQVGEVEKLARQLGLSKSKSA